MSGFRRLLIVGVAVIAVPLAALGVLPFLVSGDTFRPLLQKQLEQQLHGTVSLGTIQLSTFPLALKVQDFSVGQPAGFPASAPMVQAKQLSVSVALWPLLRNSVRIQALRLASPQVELIAAPSGKWNFSTGDSGSSETPILDELTVSDGTLAISDLKAATRSVYSHIDLTLKDLGPQRTASLTGAVRLEALASVLKLQTDFRTDPIVNAKGTLTWTSDRVRDALAVSFDAGAGSPAGVILIRSLEARLGALSASVSGFVSTNQTPTGLELLVKTTKAPMADVMRVARLAGVTLPADLVIDGDLQAGFTVKGTTATPLFNGRIAASKTRITAKELAEPVSASELAIELTPESAVSQPFTLETGSTKVTAQASLSGYTSAVPHLTASLKTAGARVEELLRMAGAYGLRPDGMEGTGSLSLDMKVVQDGSRVSYSGTGSLTGAKLAAKELPSGLDIENAGIRFSDDRIAFENVKAALNPMHFTGSLGIRNFARPDLDFNLHADTLDWAVLSRISAGSSPPGKPQAKNATAPQVTARGQLTVDRVAFEKSAVTDLKATVALADGILKLSPVTASIFGGQQSGSLTADLRGTDIAYTVQSRLTGVESGQLLSATSSVKGIVSGPLSGDLNVQFVAKPNQEPASTLNGTLRMQMGPGRIAGVQILNEIARAGNLLGLTKKQEAYTSINKLAGTLEMRNGVATTNDLLLDLGGVVLTGNGTMGLVDQSLKLKLTSTITKDYQQKNGMARVGGLLSGILGGNGDVALPLLVGGTFAQPKFSLDAARVGRNLLSSPSGSPLGSPQGAAGAVTDLLNHFKKK